MFYLTFLEELLYNLTQILTFKSRIKKYFLNKEFVRTDIIRNFIYGYKKINSYGHHSSVDDRRAYIYGQCPL